MKNKSTLQKITCILLVCIMSLSMLLVACSPKKHNDSSSSVDSADTSSVASVDTSSGDSADTSCVDSTDTSSDDSSGSGSGEQEQEQEQEPQQEFLVARYSFENAENLGEDASGNDFDATIIGNVTQSDSGIRGKAVRLDGSNKGNADAYISMPADVAKQEQITLMSWVKYEKESANAFARLFSIEEPAGGNAFHSMAHSYGEQYYVTEMWLNGAPSPAAQLSDLPIGVVNNDYNNFWHHVAVTYDGATLAFLVDGVTVNSCGVETDLSQWNVVNAFIGRTGIWGDACYNGYLDDFMVYSVALTEEEIVAINDIKPSDYLRARYDFENSENIAYDSARYSLNGIVYNNVSQVEDGIRGKAAQFTNTSNDHIEIPVSAVKGKEITVSVWVKTNQESAGDFLRVFSAENNTGGDNLVMFSKSSRVHNGFEVYMQKSTPVFMPSLEPGYPKGTVFAKDGVWQHVALTVKGSEMKLYINGELGTSATAANLLCELNPIRAIIGSTYLYADPSFNGLMDDFRIYGKALTPEQIAQENNFTPDDFLFVHYDFDDSLNCLKDQSGYGYNAAVGSQATSDPVIVDGVNNNGAYFDGNTYLELPQGILVGCQGLTITTWIKYDELPVEFTHLFHFGWPQNDNNFFLSMAGNSSGITAGAIIDGWENTFLITTDAAPTVGEWVHIAYTQNESSVTLYMNGQKVGEGTFNKDVSDLYGSPENCIGRAFSWDPLIKATLDDFRMYARVLSSEEIIDIYGDADMVKGLSSLLIGNNEITEFQPFTTDYYKVLSNNTVNVPQVVATAIDSNAKLEVVPADTLPGTTEINIEYANGETDTVRVHFMLLPESELKYAELSEVTIDDEFWNSKLDLFTDTTAPYVLRHWIEDTHDNLGNFKKVAAGDRNTGNYVGGMTWGECDFYASLAGASRLLSKKKILNLNRSSLSA